MISQKTGSAGLGSWAQDAQFVPFTIIWGKQFDIVTGDVLTQMFDQLRFSKQSALLEHRVQAFVKGVLPSIIARLSPQPSPMYLTGFPAVPEKPAMLPR